MYPYFIESDGGAVYKKFLLVLPYRSVVQRINNNEIVIKTNDFH